MHDTAAAWFYMPCVVRGLELNCCCYKLNYIQPQPHRSIVLQLIIVFCLHITINHDCCCRAVDSEPASSSCISSRKNTPVIFNFGDSNSDTGGLAAATGFNFGYPDARAFFHQPTGRLCDGRLIIDFLLGGAATLPRYVPFSLDIQVLQFRRFRNRSLYFSGSSSSKSNNDNHLLLPGGDDFRNALYTFDIGQNDLSAAFTSAVDGRSSYDQVVAKIPTFIAEIRDAMWAIYQFGGKNFWVHNTGPLGCLPEKLATYRTKTSSSKGDDDIDEYGCIKSMNEAAKAFNARLDALCQDLRLQMTKKNNSTAINIVYVDVYSIKYHLIASAASYGFENPLMACCGHGGPPYNYDASVKCRDQGQGYNICKPESLYVSWDGVHYTEAANAIVASKILSAKYSTPPLKFSSFFCN
ncbi:GDSL esterase/lipase At1g09390-like isoform X2 [Andrographis paniculata]|uniref:GDSL esterase/lipase At1g09390-like isoform X2 n=1 Tax=Andrographis paniculata TaxID=175694 RepID=UPI0021E9459E|nr:GDSL esterase/lipase At1g09390-like isoform X2 [Andrographis paniculata]